MAPIEHDYAIAFFQQLHSIAVVHSSRVCRNFAVDGRDQVHLHYATVIVAGIGAERPSQGVAVCFTDIAVRLFESPI